jgi:hypothetical protein
MAAELGFSNQKKKGKANFKTIHQLGSSRFGSAVSPKGLAQITAASPIVAVTNVLGIDGQIAFYNIQMTAHGASVNDVMRMATGTLLGWEFDIVSVVDANNFRVLPVADSAPIAAETASIMRWVTQQLSSTGGITATTTPTPIMYSRNGVDTTVLEDTGTPANSRPLPTVNFNTSGVAVNLATETTLGVTNTRVGDVTETAPVTDTASSGLNGRLQRIAQRLTSLIALLPSAIGIQNTAGSLSVTLSSDHASVPVTVTVTNAPLAHTQLNFATTNVDDTAYVQLLATIGATASKKAQIFMSSGEPLFLAFGAAAAEVDELIVIPGGNGFIDLDIPANTRLSLKAVNAATTVNTGVIIINLMG